MYDQTDDRRSRTLVMKFGGASVASTDHFHEIARIIADRTQRYGRIAVVVSAMAKMTDELADLAQAVHPDPPRREYDMLVSVGERISISLLAMALDLQGKEAVSFTGSQTGIITSTDHADAEIVEVKPERLRPVLAAGKIAIVAGFQGMSTDREITTLGRGGSDTSAVALAVALGAEKVEFYKDVGGVFSADPKVDDKATLIDTMSYGQAIDLAKSGARILAERAVEMAQQAKMPLHVRSFVDLSLPGTTVDIHVKPELAMAGGVGHGA